VHAREAELIAVREATLRKERERQLADAQKALEAERKRSQAALEAARIAEEKRDLVAFNASIKQGQNYLGKNEYQAALAAFQGAGRLAHSQKQSELVNTYIDIVVQRQAEAQAKTDEQKKALETRLAIERQRRKDAELLAKQNEDAYKAALQLAQQALAAKNYDAAQKQYDAAGKLFRTDAVLAGLKQVESARAAIAADAQKAAAAAKKAETVKQLVSAGNAAIDAKKFTEAVQSFQQAKKLAPDNLDVLAGLARAEQARDRMLADIHRKTEETDRTQNFARLLKNGQANLAAKQFDAAIANLSEAVKLNPTDATARSALKQAEAGRSAAVSDAKALAEAKTRAEAYQKHMTAGRLALNSKRFADAIKSFADAQGMMKGDKTSLDMLQEAQNAKKAADDAVAQAAKQRADDMRKAAELQKALTAARTALAGNDLTGASKALAVAKALNAKDADVLKLGRDIDQAQQRIAAEAAAQKERLQKFQTFFNSGKAALQNKKYDDALKALGSAAALMPESKEAQALYRQAQDEKRKADDALGQAKLAYQNALGAGQKALQNKNFDAAIASAEQALKLVPNDPSASKLLQQAQTEKAAASKLADSFNAAMASGDKAMTAKNYQAAVKSYTEATKLNPADTTARMRLVQAQQALADAQAALVQSSYKQSMSNGQTAMNGKQYKAAIGHFQDALKWIPNDKAATQQLNQAQQALADSMKTKTPDPKKLFDEAMQRGADLDKDKKYSEAVKAYQEALKHRPKDAAAQKALNSSQFSLHLATGQQYLDNAMWKNAQVEFESALKLFPNNGQAQKLLQKAKNKTK
jgi:tetratricopeptide (TPR) repeat protein